MDYTVFKAINSLAGRYILLDRLMILISKNMRYVFILILIFMWFRDFSSKKAVSHSVISVFVSMVMNVLIKLLYFKHRPYQKHHVNYLIRSKKDSSFPSKHTLLTFAVSTSICLRKRTLGLVMMGLSWLTGFSRIWTGHHYPSDIIGSAFIGCLISYIIDRTVRILHFFDRY